MTAALQAGVAQIQVFDNLESARQAAAQCAGPKVLCGEVNCLPPPGFDLGNSPRDWTDDRFAGRRVFMSTTNGTRAVAAAAALNPALLLVGALINAQSAARAALGAGRDITLLCASTAGEFSLEDFLGTGAVLAELTAIGCGPQGDIALAARLAFESARHSLPQTMRTGAGGRNLLRVNMAADIDACASVNSSQMVGIVEPLTLSIRAFA
jgi:2-phosphosulfolactate phosphatase